MLSHWSKASMHQTDHLVSTLVLLAIIVFAVYQTALLIRAHVVAKIRLAMIDECSKRADAADKAGEEDSLKYFEPIERLPDFAGMVRQWRKWKYEDWAREIGL